MTLNCSQKHVQWGRKTLFTEHSFGPSSGAHPAACKVRGAKAACVRQDEQRSCTKTHYKINKDYSELGLMQSCSSRENK